MAKYGLSLDPISNRISLPSQIQPIGVAQGQQEWQVAVTEATQMLPFTGTKVKCRLVRNENKLRESRQFLAEINGLCSTVNSTESGCFWTYIPNASEEEIRLQWGQIVGTAHPITHFNFPTNSAMVSSVSATNRAPREHSPQEVATISKQLLENLNLNSSAFNQTIPFHAHAL